MALFCIFLLSLLGMSATLPQDMFGKMLVFPQETNTAHVRITPSRENLGAVTVCLRYFTDLFRVFRVFTLSTPSYTNEVCGEMPLPFLRNTGVSFRELDYQRNRWQSICATWDAASGVVQLWVNGKPSTMKYVTNVTITGPMVIVIGQDEYSFGGGFKGAESFVGMITDVHMWDYVLSPCHIYNHSQKFNFPAGNILNWNSVEFQITGRVLIQKEQNDC
ncbi:C-reactive protein-like [Eucyclogobius newberryi]|uniref:C-reactive protein-like n=1 Tax=Eucyclogobius newberryi TaxID=166745 RepID=UPI003B592097